MSRLNLKTGVLGLLRFDEGTVTLHWCYEGCQLQTGVARLDLPSPVH